MTLTEFITEARKTEAALAGSVAQVIALGFLHGTVLHWVQVVSSILTAAAVFFVRNGTPKAAPAPSPPAA